MDSVFLTILNMSITGAFVIAAISIARLPLKKAPKLISYSLWGVVGFRLVLPFSFDSIFSLIPFNDRPIPMDIGMQAKQRIESGAQGIDNIISGSLTNATANTSINPLQVWTSIVSYLWIVGFLVMVIYGVISYVTLIRKMKNATLIRANIYKATNIRSPFVLGFIAPKIYLPVSLSDSELGYIILHEQTHIKRNDHIVKLAAYLVLCLHWFNPLVWLAFTLMGVDMELSVDERVLKDMDIKTRKDYSRSLVSLAVQRRIIGGSPLAFSEGEIKVRIKNILNYKKPSRVIITVAIALVAVLGMGFMADKPTVTYTPITSMKAQTYQLANMTDRQRMENMTSFYLNPDGTASFNAAMISSYIPPNCTYKVADGKLIFHAIIANVWEDDFFGHKDGDIMATFNIIDEDTLQFESANIPLFAVTGGRYVGAMSAVTVDSLKSISIGMDMAVVHDTLGSPVGMLSGLYGDIYELEDGKVVIIYYNSDNKVERIKTDTKAQTSPSDITPLYNNLDSAVSAAILSENEDRFPLGEYAVEANYVLSTEGVGSADTGETERVTVYTWVLYKRFDINGDEITDKSGYMGVDALVFNVSDKDKSYELLAYWHGIKDEFYSNSADERYNPISTPDSFEAPENLQQTLEARVNEKIITLISNHKNNKD